MNDETKMDPETAIQVLRNLQDWLYLSSMNGGSSLQGEAIDIGIAAIEDKLGR
jgi:hypothetical protein